MSGRDNRREDPGKKRDPKAEHDARKPPSADVFDFHSNADTDADGNALHHTIGTGISQAASGAHTHDGTDSSSAALWIGVTLSDPGSSATNAQLAAAIAQLNALIRQKSA